MKYMETAVQPIVALEQRIESLEAKNAFQEDMIEQLNQELAVHQAELAELKQQFKLLADRVKSMRTNQVADLSEETPPPHY
jgi:SlyX protein